MPGWQVMKMPDDLSFASAAALPAVVLTAMHAVNLVPRLPRPTAKPPQAVGCSKAGAPELIGKGRDALVHSAAGGVLSAQNFGQICW